MTCTCGKLKRSLGQRIRKCTIVRMAQGPDACPCQDGSILYQSEFGGGTADINAQYHGFRMVRLDPEKPYHARNT